METTIMKTMTTETTNTTEETKMLPTIMILKVDIIIKMMDDDDDDDKIDFNCLCHFLLLTCV